MFLQLDTKNPITYDVATKFKSIFGLIGLSNIIQPISYKDFDATVNTTIHKVSDTCIRINLVRPLTETEFNSFSDLWDKENFDFESTISSDFVAPDSLNFGKTTLTHDEYDNIALSLAKSHHEAWVKNKTDTGWRYGPYVSLIEKTHPLILPWDQLPEKHKTIDLHSPQNIINLLQGQGLSLIKTSELDAIIKLVRSL